MSRPGRERRRVACAIALCAALGIGMGIAGCGRYGPPRRKPPTAAEELRAHRAEMAIVERVQKDALRASLPTPKLNAAQKRRTGRTTR